MKSIVLAGTLLIIALQPVMAQSEKTDRNQKASNVEVQIKSAVQTAAHAMGAQQDGSVEQRRPTEIWPQEKAD